MVTRSTRELEGVVRPGRLQDKEQVRVIADEVFSVFGEYGSWLPGYLVHPGVWSFVCEEQGWVLGFAMLGVLDAEVKGEGKMGDLLAIAVRGTHHGRGVGTRLLERVVDKAHQLAPMLGLVNVRLTVAEPNIGAQRLFRRFGFVEVEGDHGHYDKGQRALRFGLRL